MAVSRNGLLDASRCLAEYGHIEVCSTSAAEAGINISAELPVEELRWWLPNALRKSPIADFPLELYAYAEADGQLRIVPRTGYAQFARQARAIGLEILQHANGISGAEVSSAAFRHLAYDWVGERGLCLRRTFSSPADLRVRRSVREITGRWTILPVDLGRTSGDDAKRSWSIPELLRYGRELAIQVGVENPTLQAMIAHGLVAGALRNPLSLQAHEVLPLIRLALFDHVGGATVEPQLKAEVHRRLSIALERHQADEYADFKRWLMGPHSNLPKSLAKRRKAPDHIEEAAIKSVLAELAWEGCRSISNCMGECMRWLKHCLGPNLMPSAAGLLDRMYRPQPDFGGLSLPMLLDRAPLMGPLMPALWEHPHEPSLVGALHRLFAYYGEMVGQRRELDRAAKSQRQPSYNEPIQQEDADEFAKRLVVLAQKTAAEAGIVCGICQGQLRFTLVPPEETLDSTLEAKGVCPLHPEMPKSVEIPWQNQAEE